MNVILEVSGGPESGKKKRLMRGQILEVGRTVNADVRLSKDPELSSTHFAVEYSFAGVRLLDRASRNGTFLNGKKVDESGCEPLRHGDKILAGQSTFTVVIEGEQQPYESSDPTESVEPIGNASAEATGSNAPDSAAASELAKLDESPYKGETASEICAGFELPEESQPLLDEQQSPQDFIGRLVQESQFPSAVQFLSHALSKREAVWWAIGCVESSSGGALDEPSTTALESARSWVLEPSDENRRAAGQAAEATEFSGPSSWVALAAMWSGGSLAPPDLPPVPPGEQLTAQAICGALMMAATSGEAEEVEGKYRGFLEKGNEIGAGDAPWES